MKPNLLVTIVFATALLQGCGTMETTPEQNYVTANMSVDSAKALIVERFAMKGGFCDEGKYTLTCNMPLPKGQDILARALVTESRGGSTKSTLYFTFIDNKNKTTKVYIRHTLSATTANGAIINSGGNLAKSDMDKMQEFFDKASKR